MQLFGAIVPKMIGQKNSQNDFGVRRSFEEVFLSMPSLLSYIVSAFDQSNLEGTSHELNSHSDLVPFLIMLSNVQLGSVNVIQPSLLSNLVHLRHYTKLLLASEVYFVRELASKAFVSLHSAEEILVYEKMIQNVISYLLHGGSDSITSENHLHGYLLVLKRAFELYSNLRKFESAKPDTAAPTVSLVCAALLYKLEICDWRSGSWTKIFSHIEDTLEELQFQKYRMIGYDDWTYTLIKIALKICEETSFEELFALCVDSPHDCVFQNFLKALPARKELVEKKADFVLQSLCAALQKYSTQADSKILRCILQALVSFPSQNCVNQIDPEKFEFLINLDYFTYQGTNLRALCSLVRSTSTDLLSVLLKEIRRTSDIAWFNKDIRVNSAESMLLLSNNPPVAGLKQAWLAILDIVQDEELEIRLIGCKCYQNITKMTEFSYSPETVVEEMLNEDTMRRFLPMDQIFEILLENLGTDRFEIPVHDEITNPFDLGIVNFYKEDVRTISICGRALVRLSYSSELRGSSVLQNLSKYYSSYIKAILKVSSELLENNILISATSYILTLRCYFLLSILIALVEVGVFKTENTVCSKNDNLNFCKCLQIGGKGVCIQKIKTHRNDICKVFGFKYR